ncbi:synaptotagmin-like protein 1 isoform X1 [Zootoca vivipara]|uniref:synaptotagmin-like protein 1 isoform X1 n=1 Tax=Zootoca vivipara TaxID=8524 RepID=UPI00293BC232|nr:synaptotagmin-like protein 1 isoform X1 [Zootoca vivipara]XP_034976166.2 synaptotagmin-like protein 1 isoform X1 [Zootoca vivipara]XP_034976168.2 synaptotagmin-like protein 1 isoform X1 [Zootoca vivipara]
MDQDIGMDSLLDLSFLTEEEQNAIAEVLRRDSQLRMSEEGRISKLRESVSDPSWFKILSGDWFCDVRSKRHRHNHFGSDIVRASIRRKKKPKAGEPDPKQRASLGDLEAISEPPAEEENALDAVDGLPSETDPQPSMSKETQMADLTLQDVIQSPEQMPENKPETSDSFSSLSSETGEEDQQNIRVPAIMVTMQSNESLENGQESTLDTSPPKNNAMGSRNKLMSTSSSFSSLSSSTMSGSMMSVFSDNDVGNVDVRGCIQFSLQYDSRKKALHIQVIQCRDLAEAKKQRSDPYVKSYLLPDKSNHSKRKTAVKKRSLDPIFNETLKYKIDKADLQGRILNLSVWHHDTLSRNLFMGEVEIVLNSWDWSNTSPQWFNLQPRTPVTPDALCSRGILNLALKFIPAGSGGEGLPPTGELHIWVKDAQNIIPQRGSTADSFVQCYILPDDSKVSRQRTRIVKKSLSPTFNHTMVYDGFQAKDLAEACAEFTIWDQETFSKQQLGGIRLSLGTGNSYGLPVSWMDSTEEERHAWEMVFKQPGQWVEASLPLRTNLNPRT